MVGKSSQFSPTGSRSYRELNYDELCIEWRRALSEEVLRSLAADYLRNMIDADTTDAFKEYEYRWGPYTKGSPTSSKAYRNRRQSR